MTGRNAISFIKFPKNWHADRLVGYIEDLIDTPIPVDRAAGVKDCAQGMLESIAIAGSLANKEVGAEIKKGTAPVGSPPRRSAIEPAITGLRLTLEANNEVVPNTLWC